MITVHCLTRTMELEEERIGCCKPSDETMPDCLQQNVKFVKFDKVGLTRVGGTTTTHLLTFGGVPSVVVTAGRRYGLLSINQSIFICIR